SLAGRGDGNLSPITLDETLAITDNVLGVVGGTGITVDDGDEEVSNVTKINFVGATVTDDDDGEITVTILENIESVNQTILTQYTESTVSGDDGSNLIQPDLGLPIL